ncbi:Na+/H+ antiporter [Azospirillum agricola]|uniref:Na+/H+ antiporter n=1 Tax=Azospirillum agricola TaxID=1720247 RepID=UPI001AE47700|nr:Na+/H+ antiporter [Azospirillum agricola]
MGVITIALILLLAVVLSGFIARALPWAIPRPLVQICLGGVIGLAADLRVQLDPDIFFLLFLPPLLFLDGWRIPKEELLKDAKTVLELALGLVLFTVIGVGFFINWMIPAMPLPVAFALAAVLSPTDPIAVSAIAARVPIPKRLMHILEGESLLNDASGLVCLRFAIAATLTGAFSLYDATLSFLWVALGGIAVGVLVTWCITRAKEWIARRYGEESGSQILISLLIPFASYLVAEHLHCSGILAAVAAGVTMSVAEVTGQTLAVTRIRRNTVWDMIQFALNGIIFVLLGEQLPTILAGAVETVRVTGHHDPGWLVIYVVAINLALAALRFAWVWVSLSLTLFRANLRGRAMNRPSWRLVAATSLAGARGTITLAGILTLPVALDSGAPFPARDLAILLAMGVIIVSLIAASIGLPMLLKGLEMPPEPSHQAEEDRARIAAAKAAIAAIERVEHDMAAGRDDADLYVAAAAQVMDVYRTRIEALSQEGAAADTTRHTDAIGRTIHVAALKAERKALFQMVRRRELSGEMARKIVRELDLLEARYDG